MWTHKLLSVLVVISVSQAHTIHQKLIPATNEDYIPEGVYVLDGGDDNRRGFVVTRDATPNGVKVNAGFQLFEIPIGPQFTYIREKEASEEPVRVEPVNSVWSYAPLRKSMNSEISEANDEEEIVQVPVRQLKQEQHIGSLQEAFPWGKGSRAFIPEESARRNEKFSAGLTLFGIPVGPQLSYKSNKNEDGTGTEADVLSIFGPLIAKFERIVKKLVTEYVLG